MKVSLDNDGGMLVVLLLINDSNQISKHMQATSSHAFLNHGIIDRLKVTAAAYWSSRNEWEKRKE
jgi:hypothetical protein